MAREDDDIAPSARRMRMRRTRGGFTAGAGTSTRSESLRTSAEHDEVDDAIDPDELAEAPVRLAQRPRPPTDPSSPAARLHEVSTRGSAAYSKEYRLMLLHRMLIRRVPLDQIATQLGVSISTVEKDRVELKRFLQEQAKELNINEMVGNQTNLYDEIVGMSLQIAGKTAGNDAVPVPMRLAAMRTALASNADKNRFYASSGVYDVLKFRRAEDGTAVSDIALLMQETATMLRQISTIDDDFSGFDDPDDLAGEVVEV